MRADDLYWSPVDFDGEESNNFYRSYIDPWDLENYAYMRQHAETTEPYSGVSIPGEEPVSTSTFTYMPGEERYGSIMTSDRTTSNYAAIEEAEIRDAKYPSPPDHNVLYVSRHNNRSRDFSHERNHPFMNIPHATAGFRKVITPSNRNKRPRSYSYSSGYEPLQSLQQIYNIEDNPKYDDGTTSSPIYDDIKTYSSSSRKFGLSRYGHLKIDYSYSWHNLHKYICN